MKRARIEFYGDVEGTGYRFFIKQKAVELGLKGFCQLSDSTKVEVEVEGSTDAVDEFIRFVEKGVSAQAETNAFKIQIFETLIGYKTMGSDLV
jgi:acylphosphatase